MSKLVNIGEAIRSKSPKLYKYLPGFVIKLLEKIIKQKEYNKFILDHTSEQGVDFADSIINELTQGVEVVGLENLEKGKKYIFASNHPLGGMDGVAMISVLGQFASKKIFLVVNDLLMFIEPLQSVFLPINKHGSQDKAKVERINKEFESDSQILYFPAGLVSRRQPNGEIKDLRWQKNFLSKAIEYNRDIVPIYFEGLNSSFFYNFAYWRKKLGIKINIDMLFLPREIFNKKKVRFKMIIGKPISISHFDKSKSLNEWAEWTKQEVYRLKQH